MMYKTDHIAWAAEAVAVFQGHCRTADEHAIADLICDLGHLADERGLDFLSEVKRGIGHWYAEHHAGDGEVLGPDAAVEIIIRPKTVPCRRWVRGERKPKSVSLPLNTRQRTPR
jgi:hypothetical protein